MTLLRRALVLSTAIVAAAGVGVVGRMSVASSATAPIFSYTVAGTDAHSLDSQVVTQFVAGGGVTPVYTATGANPQAPYLEVGLGLPVGAKVTSVAVTYSHCDGNVPDTFVFGSYMPATRVTVQNATLTGTVCGANTITKTGSPITTTTAGRRYAIDFAYPAIDLGISSVFYGATVKYTCTSPCVP